MVLIKGENIPSQKSLPTLDISQLRGRTDKIEPSSNLLYTLFIKQISSKCFKAFIKESHLSRSGINII